MNKPELYNRTIEILVQAYLNDTLEHGDCTACAVGNICLAAGAPKATNDIAENNFFNNASWKKLFYTTDNYQTTNFSGKHTEAERQAAEVVSMTGYTIKELAKIEYAFETAYEGVNEDEYMFNGLMAVIDVLDQIHGNTDTEVTTTQKNRFTKLVTD